LQITAKIIRLTFLGGAFGTLARFTLWAFTGDLYSVIFANLIGAALIGYLNGRAVQNKKYDTDEFNALWKVGFAGGFTTMSAFAALIVIYNSAVGSLALAGALAVTALGIGAYWLTFTLSSRQSKASARS
jgi:fluoride ion exporter CrcB/FEX